LFDVVSPSVEYIIQQPQTKNIGVIGTTNTINSKTYSQKFKEKNGIISVYEISCPLFVPIIEEGWSDTDIAKEIARIYLQDFEKNNIDSLILGCTHYPIMASTIQSVLSDNIQMVFSGDTVGLKLSSYLRKNNLINTSSLKGNINFYVSDFPQKFDDLGSIFFGRKLNNVKYISLL
jgi:glutamate racemase